METWAKCGRPPLITSPFWVERGRRSESSLVGARGSFPGESSLHSFSVRSCPGGLAIKGLLGEGAYYLHRWWAAECTLEPGASVSTCKKCYSLDSCLGPRIIHPLHCLERNWQRTISTSSLQWRKTTICSIRYTWKGVREAGGLNLGALLVRRWMGEWNVGPGVAWGGCEEC